MATSANLFAQLDPVLALAFASRATFEQGANGKRHEEELEQRTPRVILIRALDVPH